MITEFLSVLAFWGQTLVRRFFPLTGAEECHYINGPETLPPPLTKEEEARVMDNIRSGAPGAREPLITHNLRLVVYIAKKFESPGAGVEDLISIGTIGLIKAVTVSYTHLDVYKRQLSESRWEPSSGPSPWQGRWLRKSRSPCSPRWR